MLFTRLAFLVAGACRGIVGSAGVGSADHCAGAITVEAMTEIRKMGFVLVPFNGAEPDPAVADRFVQVVTSAEAEALGLTNARLKQWALEYARPDR